MRCILFLAICLLGSTLISWAQTHAAPSDSSRNKPYRYEETMPVFPGGPSALLKFLSDSMRYPKSALRDQVQDKVFISFLVNPEGRTTDIQVKQGVRADLDAEALRVAKRLTQVQWQPGTQNRKPVTVSYTVPLTFSINNGPGGFTADSLDQLPVPTFLLPVATWTASRGPLPAGKGLIYGSCIQRLGFSSGGLPQHVLLVDLATPKVLRVIVKPTMKSRKENEFCVALPAGTYALYQYYYSYGNDELRKPSNQIGTIAATRYVFTVQAGQLNYVGTWDFSTPQQPSFRPDETALQKRINPTYRKLGFADAVLSVPK
ncbi:energy transducer TonB [Hymenobacter sp. BT186]|uniref:Energy transducer TonB n=1 Tax=Hymenobacter telluris TaxID=2816474 RepID=A0A939ETM0_9BACT|nr:energy transducer TonB [Hymenobacter telluris]MBO0357300.1 energy transducer TonB [Hymenobacter telluris]MBW3373326.1 energy transducer TonB [Hymenobacter norwichensis]